MLCLTSKSCFSNTEFSKLSKNVTFIGEIQNNYFHQFLRSYFLRGVFQTLVQEKTKKNGKFGSATHFVCLLGKFWYMTLLYLI